MFRISTLDEKILAHPKCAIKNAIAKVVYLYIFASYFYLVHSFFSVLLFVYTYSSSNYCNTIFVDLFNSKGKAIVFKTLIRAITIKLQKRKVLIPKIKQDRGNNSKGKTRKYSIIVIAIWKNRKFWVDQYDFRQQ